MQTIDKTLILNRQYNKGSNLIAKIVKWLFVLFSLFVSIYVAVVSDTMADYYQYLWILPFVYSICILASYGVLKEALQSFPVMLIVLLFFVRMVISPLLYAYAGVREQITINVEENTIKAIFLVSYECIAVFITLCVLRAKYRTLREKLNERENAETPINNTIKAKKIYEKGDKRLILFLLICIIVIMVFYYITPHIFDTFRTILNIKDSDFTSIETDYSNIDTSSFAVKFALVTSNYMLNVLRILIPATIIYFLSKIKNRPLAMFISAIMVVLPIFVIAGAIARSVYYVIVLMYEFVYLYSPKNQKMKMIGMFALGALLILAYWIIRYMVNAKGTATVGGFFNSFSGTVNAYFSGVNVVTGIYNMPDDLATRMKFLYQDVFGAIPYGGTLFGIVESEKIQPVFNVINNTSGNIPPTIGLSRYYFGVILAPLMSVIFTIVAYKSGLQYDITKRPLKKIIYQLMGLYCALGLVMYNFPISFGNIIQLVLVLYIIERICYGKERQM